MAFRKRWEANGTINARRIATDESDIAVITKQEFDYELRDKVVELAVDMKRGEKTAPSLLCNF